MYDDLGQLEEHLRKLNCLIQHGTTYNYFLEAENLNLYAQLPEKTLWMILEQGLSPATRATIAWINAPLKSFTIWKRQALTIGATLDSLNTHSCKNNSKPKSRHDCSSKDEDKDSAKGEK